MRELVRKPKGKQLRVKPESLRVSICDRREVLETCKRYPAPGNYELPSIRGAHADHEHNVNIHVLIKQPRALLFGRAGQRDHVSAFEHLPKIGAIREGGRAHDISEVGTIAVDNVILPVRLENSAVGLKVALVGGDSVGAIENGEKIWQQVDQHSAGSDLREAVRNPSHVREHPVAGALDAE
ncbi:MAG: hypothetical protein M3Z05_20660 [Gemmatimonadota bacterium]|nr:hypothetical protein [Gemmatimonadota bacterium]